MPKTKYVLELRPDKYLLDPSFGGYKLCLDDFEHSTKVISNGIEFQEPNDDQFSFQHVKLFSLQNHLHVNPYSNDMYFVDKKGYVTRVNLSVQNHIFNFQVVWRIPNLEPGKQRLYNISMEFVTLNLVVITDGAGKAFIIEMNKSDQNELWQVTTTIYLRENKLGFLLTHARLNESEFGDMLHVVFMHVEQKKDKGEGASTSAGHGYFHTVIEWVTLTQNRALSWAIKSKRKLEVEGSVDCAGLESDSKALFIVSDKVPKWTYDSEKEVPREETEGEERPKEKVYSWLQTEDDIVIYVKMAEDVTMSDVTVLIDFQYMTVHVRDREIINGVFSHRIDKDLASWIMEKNVLEIYLLKRETGLMWPRLFENENDNDGEQIFNPEIVAKVHEQLEHLCSEKEVDSSQPTFNPQMLEDCDTAPRDAVLVRMSPENHLVTHKICLSSFQFLFKLIVDPQKNPALCLRHDVDACVWQFKRGRDFDENWPRVHVGTFSALGYVQASKTKKKFITCPADLVYAAICESSRYIYVYRQPTATPNVLKNRVTGEECKTFSYQQVINLNSDDRILGVNATHSHLYVLTETTLYAFAVGE